MKTLLPPSSSPLERALAESSAFAPPPQLVPSLWNGDSCPEPFLPWLAWALRVDDWSPIWPEERKRAAIRQALDLHCIRGTPAALKHALAIRGQPDAVVIERINGMRRHGKASRNGMYRRGGPGSWATFKVILKRPVTLRQATEITAMIEKFKRNCCWLIELDYSAASLSRNGQYRRDGQYTRGLINGS